MVISKFIALEKKKCVETKQLEAYDNWLSNFEDFFQNPIGVVSKDHQQRTFEASHYEWLLDWTLIKAT